MTEIRNKIIIEIAEAAKNLSLIGKKFQQYTKDVLSASAAETKKNVSGKQVTATLNAQASATRKASAAAKDLGVSWTTVKRIFAGQVIFRALSAITNQMRDSVGVAQELGIKLAEAITIAPGELALTTEGVARLSEEVKLLSESFGIDQVELATAAYQVYSNQIGDATESTQFLSDAVLFAKATVTDAANSVDLLSGVINSYGLEAGAAARVSDVFTKAVELGRFRIDDIANSMGRVNPIAAQLGIKIEEVAAALATLTIKGVSPDKALTQLLAVMLKMVKPSTALTKALNEIGFTNIKAATSTLGLIGTLKALTATTDGTIESLGRLFPRVRGIQGVLGLVGDEGERFNSIFKEIQETSDGATKKFAEFILATEAEKFKRNIQAIKNLFIEDFGKPIIAIINDFIEVLGNVPKAIETINKVLGVGAVALATILVVKLTASLALLHTAYVSAAVAAGGFSAAVAATPVGLAALAGALLALGLVEFIQLIVDAIEPLREMTQAQKELEATTKQLQKDFEAAGNTNINAMSRLAQEQLELGRNAIRELVKANQDAADDITFIQNQVTGNFIDQLATRLKTFEDFARDSANALNLAAKDIAKIDDSIAKIRARSEQELFDLRIRGLSKWEQRVARARRAQALLQKAAITRDKVERESLFRTAAAEASRAKSSSLIKRIADARIKSLEKEKSAVARNARILQGMAPSIQEAVDKMKVFQESIKAAGQELRDAGLDKTLIGIAEAKLFKLTIDQRAIARQLEDDLGAAFGIAISSLGQAEAFKFRLDPLPIEFKFKDAFSRMQTALESRRISLPVFLTLAGILGPDGQALTPKSTPEEADALITFLKERAVAASKKIQSDIGALLIPEVAKVQQDMESAIAAALDLSVKGFRRGVRLRPSKVIQEEAKALKEALVAFNEAVTSQNLDAINRTFTGLVDLLATTENINVTPLLEQLGGIEQILAGFNNIDANLINTAQEIGEALQKAADKAIGVSAAAATIGSAAEQGANQAVNALNTIGPAANRQRQDVQNLASDLRNLIALQREAGTGVAKAMGGSIPNFLASGGQARGTDTVSVQAAPGEFFVNAAASRRFIPELNAINQGLAPSPRNNSQTTNNSFSGDININVPAGTSVNGRQVAADIRRELRRKTSSLS